MNKAGMHNPDLPGERFTLEGGQTGVLLIHNLTATTYEVRSLGERLNTLGYTVCAPLLPGHGTNPADLSRTRWLDWAQAAEDGYHQLDHRCEQVFVGGNAAGALLALYLASMFPEIRGVLVYAPTLRPAKKPGELTRLYLTAPFKPTLPNKNIEFAESWQGYEVNPVKSAIEMKRLERAVEQMLPLVRQPVLVIEGQTDAGIEPENGAVILHGVHSPIKIVQQLNIPSHQVLTGQELDQVVGMTQEFVRGVFA